MAILAVDSSEREPTAIAYGTRRRKPRRIASLGGRYAIAMVVCGFAGWIAAGICSDWVGPRPTASPRVYLSFNHDGTFQVWTSPARIATVDGGWDVRAGMLLRRSWRTTESLQRMRECLGVRARTEFEAVYLSGAEDERDVELRATDRVIEFIAHPKNCDCPRHVVSIHEVPR